MRLVEVFQEIEAKAAYTCRDRYSYERTYIPKEYPKKPNLNDLIAYVERLKERYPDKGFDWAIRKIGGREFFVIRRKPYDYRNPPIYIDLESGRWYIPASYVRRKPKLNSAASSNRELPQAGPRPSLLVQ